MLLPLYFSWWSQKNVNLRHKKTDRCIIVLESIKSKSHKECFDKTQ